MRTRRTLWYSDKPCKSFHFKNMASILYIKYDMLKLCLIFLTSLNSYFIILFKKNCFSGRFRW